MSSLMIAYVDLQYKYRYQKQIISSISSYFTELVIICTWSIVTCRRNVMFLYRFCLF